MPLESVSAMMARAQRERYAVGYFESWNLESLQGVIDAAELTRSPIIIGFNGEFMSHEGRRAQERIGWYGALGRAAAESAAVPCAFIFNECAQDEWTRRAVTSGFNLVMPSDAAAASHDYLCRTAAITEYAHTHDVAVEAEIGDLPCGAEGHSAGGALTDPDEAAAFVEQTGIDLLAVSAGNVHIKMDGEQAIDLHHLQKIRNRINIPLVLHGGTGITAVSLREAIQLGVAKVNYGTYLKQRYLASVRLALGSENAQENPHELLGIGGARDVLVEGRLAVRAAVLERIELLGCCGKA